jgi:hypothetical protein
MHMEKADTRFTAIQVAQSMFFRISSGLHQTTLLGGRGEDNERLHLHQQQQNFLTEQQPSKSHTKSKCVTGPHLT